jgi:hypothetical protein
LNTAGPDTTVDPLAVTVMLVLSTGESVLENIYQRHGTFLFFCYYFWFYFWVYFWFYFWLVIIIVIIIRKRSR